MAFLAIHSFKQKLYEYQKRTISNIVSLKIQDSSCFFNFQDKSTFYNDCSFCYGVL